MLPIIRNLFQNPLRLFCTRTFNEFDELTTKNVKHVTDKPKKETKPRCAKVSKHFQNTPHLKELKEKIPLKYFYPKRRSTVQNLYLVDQIIAKSVVTHVLPFLKSNHEQVICETNAGLGLIASELLNSGIKIMRLYESCSEFRTILKDYENIYPGRIELFIKDIFQLNQLSSIDKYDQGNRVEQLLKGIPKRNWNEEPVITIIGPMPNTSFINYLLKKLVLQQEIVTYGRVQIFALMKPADFIKLTANPSMNLHTYQVLSILFQLFFECTLLDKYSRKSFLPWETVMKITVQTRLHSLTDMDYIYLVRINFKPVLPVQTQHLTHLFYFVKQGFHRGKNKIIPTVEKWLPGIGINLISPSQEANKTCFPNMNIYTEFGELTPPQILHIFMEMLNRLEYTSSPFHAVVESEILKSETIETDLIDNK